MHFRFAVRLERQVFLYGLNIGDNDVVTMVVYHKKGANEKLFVKGTPT